MEIVKTKDGSAFTVKLIGRLDTATAPMLEEIVQNELSDVTALTLDLSDLAYLSSAGLRVLLGAQKIMNKQGEMVLTDVCPDVREIFEITGFSDILTIR